MSQALLIFISCENDAQAEKIGKHLLKQKLAACIQVVEQVNSTFLWPPGSGKFSHAQESLLLVKTLESKWKALEKEVAEIHSYENPEIIALPVSHVRDQYLDWIKQELS